MPNPITIESSDALIVVDVQNDFCPGGALAVTDGDAIIPLINRLMPSFAQVVITQDWHPAGHISFASRHHLPPFSTIQLSYGAQVLWPDHCIQGSDGAKLHQALHQDHAHLLIKKGYDDRADSYSAFADADGNQTGLAGYLHDRGIRRVFVAGLATDFCVAWTAMDSHKNGFDTYVIDDACRGIDANGSLIQAWQTMNKAGISKITSAALVF